MVADPGILGSQAQIKYYNVRIDMPQSDVGLEPFQKNRMPRYDLAASYESLFVSQSPEIIGRLPGLGLDVVQIGLERHGFRS